MAETYKVIGDYEKAIEVLRRALPLVADTKKEYKN
jgi:hypothetical protein